MTTAWPGAWLPRRPPLAPVAVVGHGPAARALAAATLERMQKGEVFSAVRAGDTLVIRWISGAEGGLPWAVGVEYHGDVDGLLLPIHLEPLRSPALMAAWCREQKLAMPVLVLPEGRLLPLGRATVCPADRLRELTSDAPGPDAPE